MRRITPNGGQREAGQGQASSIYDHCAPSRAVASQQGRRKGNEADAQKEQIVEPKESAVSAYDEMKEVVMSGPKDPNDSKTDDVAEKLGHHFRQAPDQLGFPGAGGEHRNREL